VVGIDVLRALLGVARLPRPREVAWLDIYFAKATVDVQIGS
jgi:hypothetical protein